MAMTILSSNASTAVKSTKKNMAMLTDDDIVWHHKFHFRSVVLASKPREASNAPKAMQADLQYRL